MDFSTGILIYSVLDTVGWSPGRTVKVQQLPGHT